MMPFYFYKVSFVLYTSILFLPLHFACALFRSQDVALFAVNKQVSWGTLKFKPKIIFQKTGIKNTIKPFLLLNIKYETSYTIQYEQHNGKGYV